MPWTQWQIIEFHAHEEFGVAQPEFQELAEWLADRFAMDSDDASLHVLTDLIFLSWDRFNRLSEPDTIA